MSDLSLSLFWVIVAVILAAMTPTPLNLIWAFAGGVIFCDALHDFYKARGWE